MLHPHISFPTSALLIALLLSSCTPEPVSQVLGTLERDRLTLVSTSNEFITSQPVSEGSRVAAGDLVVQLDPTARQIAITGIQALIDAAQANLLKLQAGPRPEEIAAAKARTETAQAVLTESEQALARTRDLVNRRLAAQADLDNAEAGRASNAARLREAQAQLQLLLSGTRTEDITQAEANLRNLDAQLAAAQRQLADLSILAPGPAIIDSLPWETGERVSAGAVVAILLGDQPPYARVYLPEPWRQHINVGSTLPVHVDGSTTAFSGVVRWIALDPGFTPYYALNSAERTRLVYMAEIQLPDSARELPAGLPVQVDLPQ